MFILELQFAITFLGESIRYFSKRKVEMTIAYGMPIQCNGCFILKFINAQVAIYVD